MKKTISALLVVGIFLSIATPAFAANKNLSTLSDATNVYTQELEDGYIFTQQTGSKVITIRTSNENHLIEISIKYADNPNQVYQWIIDDYPVPVFLPNEFSFWAEIIKYAEARTDQASVVTFLDSDLS